LGGEEKAQRRRDKKDDHRLSQDKLVALTCGWAELGRGAHVSIVTPYLSLVKRVVQWADSLISNQ
jgi:hypothetical protein